MNDGANTAGFLAVQLCGLDPGVDFHRTDAMHQDGRTDQLRPEFRCIETKKKKCEPYAARAEHDIARCKRHHDESRGKTGGHHRSCAGRFGGQRKINSDSGTERDRKPENPALALLHQRASKRSRRATTLRRHVEKWQTKLGSRDTRR